MQVQIGGKRRVGRMGVVFYVLGLEFTRYFERGAREGDDLGAAAGEVVGFCLGELGAVALGGSGEQSAGGRGGGGYLEAPFGEGVEGESAG